MIRGAFILAVGFGVGYTMGLNQNPEMVNVLDKLEDMATRFNAWLDESAARQDAVEGTAKDVSDETAADKNDNAALQGESS